MRTKACIVIVIACLVATGEAVAGNFCELERIHYRAEGDGVSAEFVSVDTSTCALGIETTVHVDASVGVINVVDVCGHADTRDRDVMETNSTMVAVVISVYDQCLGMEVRSITGTGVAEEIHVNPNRKTASLRAAFEGTDELDQPVSLAIDLVWDGVGRKDRSRERFSAGHGVVRVVYHASGSIRDGLAAGSVVVDGIDVTPQQSIQGTIEKNALRELIAYR